MPSIQVHNTKFLSIFVCDPEHQIAFLDAALATLFSLLPSVKNICYLLPESIVLFPPLSSPKYVPTGAAAASAPQKDGQEGAVPAADKPEQKKAHNTGHKRHPQKFNALRRRTRHSNDQKIRYFTEVPSKDNGFSNSTLPYSLQICARRDVFPPLKVRRARVEDCDDLLPMFKKQNVA
jgi:hypothetical protein